MSDIFKKLPAAGISSPQVKLANRLAAAKKLPEEYANDKDADRLFICEGDWAAEMLLKNNIRIRMFLVCPERKEACENEKVLASVIEASRESYVISEKTCGRISDRDGADYCFIIAVMPEIKLDDIVLKENMTGVVLDGQEQPGNIGAILRSVDACGGDFAIYVNRRCRITHPRLIRSSLGAAFTVPFVEASNEELCRWLEKNNFKAVVTDLTATKSYIDEDYSGRIAVVCGNEYNGISPEWREKPYSSTVIIPMLGSVESLNVGFAATLVCYESSLRQKGLIVRRCK
ncbi:MAG: hypothetical protein K6G89_07430 [Clostridia bacterium]|nr:hypothetical protein [Clostridia bacterium]